MIKMPVRRPVVAGQAPIDTGRLDALLEAAGLDALVVTSKHNVRYLLGGYSFFMYEATDAAGLSRYLPAVIYRRGRPLETRYIGNPNEAHEAELGAFWMDDRRLQARGTTDAAALCAESIRHMGLASGRIGIEYPFLPTDAFNVLARELEGAAFSDATFVLERLRAVKTDEELAALRYASDAVLEAMLATFGAMRPGWTKHDLERRLALEQLQRGLGYDFCLMTAGRSFNRAPSDQVIEAGDIVSLDSGGSFRGYIGDLCRMGIVGEPDAELIDALAEVEAIQQAARQPIRAGIQGGAIDAGVASLLAEAVARGRDMDFVAHGMGLVAHEAPRLTDKAPVPYPAYDRERPLAAGMVVSIETTLKHRRGYIKLEDTVAVTQTGWVGFGDGGRSWNGPG